MLDRKDKGFCFINLTVGSEKFKIKLGNPGLW
jgi:hypothetical protein